MAIEVTSIYNRYLHTFNEEDKAQVLGKGSTDLKSFLPVLHYSTTTEQSMRLNMIEKGAIIIAGSGMCNGGRIRHHLRHNLSKKHAHVIMVGYQAMGTPGRALVDGAKIFRMGRDKVVVKAKIHTIGGFSAHAGQSQLLEWAGHFSEPKPHLYLVHGEDDAKATLAGCFKDNGWQVFLPGPGESISL